VAFGAPAWLLIGPLWAAPCALAGLIVAPLVAMFVVEYRQPEPEDLLSAGRPHDALAALDRRMGTDRLLAEKWPSQFADFLARKLVCKSAALQAMDRLPQALDAVDEAVDLLTDREPKCPPAVLASALYQQGSVLAALSRHGEALGAVETAVRLYRDLAIGDRGCYLPRLAEALTHQADALGYLDRFDEAHAAAAEATLIRSDMIPAASYR
jgi:tetratricopeptide (TPR) repeat protein